MTDPIGVFDSGVGGLTVMRALKAQLPKESFLYLGDTARVPYGSKSPQVVERYARNCAKYLVDHGAKAIVIACNTASAIAVESLSTHLQVPVIGVIEPCATLAAKQSVSGRIGIIGTYATIRSNRYATLITEQRPDAVVFSQPCPMFVPLAEENLHSHPATKLLAEEYLAPLLKEKIDTLVLGCTHYPILHATLSAVCGPTVQILDSASAVAKELHSVLTKCNSEQKKPTNQGKTIAEDKFFTTDNGERFAEIGETFLGKPIGNVEWIDLV